jgi:hypothetical protein
MPKTMKAAKPQEPPEILKGWKAIGAYLGIGAAAAQRWAKKGMPVRREGRYTVADTSEIRHWLAQEAHMAAPAHIATTDTDISAALKESISAVRRHRRLH